MKLQRDMCGWNWLTLGDVGSQPAALVLKLRVRGFPNLTGSLLYCSNRAVDLTLPRSGRVEKRGHELFGEGTIHWVITGLAHWANWCCTVENDCSPLPARLAGARLATLPRIGSSAMCNQRAGGLRKPRMRNFRMSWRGNDLLLYDLLLYDLCTTTGNEDSLAYAAGCDRW